MGYGEVIGNESVHWIVVHEDDQGAAVSLSPRQSAEKHASGGHDVHVGQAASGRDPVVLADVGKRKGHAGHYRVKLRFRRKQDAEAAIAAVRSVGKEKGLYVLTLDVPVIRRKSPDDPPPAEVRIDW